MQIAALFASGPPFPPAEPPPIPGGEDELALAGEGGGGGHDEIAERAPNGYGQGVGVAIGVPEFDAGSIRSINSGVLEALQFGLEARLALADSTTFDGIAVIAPPTLTLPPPVQGRHPSTLVLSQKLISPPTSPLVLPKQLPSDNNSRRLLPTHPADPDPARWERPAQVVLLPTRTKKSPVVAPRLTKAAALRLGLERPATLPGKKGPSAANASSGRSRGIKAGSGVEGGNNRSSVSVSPHTAPSTTSQKEEDNETETEAAVKEQLRKNIFEGVPGHKRNETISVCSVSQPPSIPPRTNSSAALRKEGAPPPGSFKCEWSLFS
ncbi:hypothetical protein BKA83DRAFT_4566014 [Pisolithus microcarpus]|nr:hypothetical protein BKA83DRAFT_4566014 [Pisolithus microcarpus]